MLSLNMFDETYVERHCESDDERRALRAVKRQLKVKQIGGDDGYHYCVVRYGTPVLRGCMRSEAYGHLNRMIRDEMNCRGFKMSKKEGAY